MTESLRSSCDTKVRPLPKVFVLELTKRCNHHCRYCYTVWGDPATGYEQHGNGEMPASEVREMVSMLQDETPVESIALSDGDPLLREDLPEILTFISDRGIAPVIITNGTLLTSEKTAATMAGGNYETTLLSHRQEVHDQLCGRRGAWEAVVDGMANVHQAGGNMTAVFVATKLNYMDLPTTAELALALGARGLMYNRLNLGAHNLHEASRLLPTPEMIRENLDTLEAIGKQNRLPIAVAVVIEPCVVDVRGYEHIHFGWCPLAEEDAYFTIDPAGNVRICNHSPIVLGNLKQERFSNIYYKHPYVRSFRETWPVECADCEPELKELCRGGCKAAAEQCYGTISRVDPFVTLSQRGQITPPA